MQCHSITAARGCAAGAPGISPVCAHDWPRWTAISQYGAMLAARLDELLIDHAQTIKSLAMREHKSERSIRMTVSLAFVSPSWRKPHWRVSALSATTAARSAFDCPGPHSRRSAICWGPDGDVRGQPSCEDFPGSPFYISGSLQGRRKINSEPRVPEWRARRWRRTTARSSNGLAC